uniref:Alpha/beta hydrolase fold-3 domain-containing protein n=1 Tax=Nelumbo nucifera TaxID=4432 RepID=A0A822YMW5_NELNU|nr:TPA_asm: hypothetical protein HUJ06_009519 [Nelumbo nucifera]
MPSVAVKLYSVFFKFLLKHRLQKRTQSTFDDNNPFGVTSRPEDPVAAANPSFTDGVATKDIHIDAFTSLSVRIFLPDTCLAAADSESHCNSRARARTSCRSSDLDSTSAALGANPNLQNLRRSSYGVPGTPKTYYPNRRNSYSSSIDAGSLNSKHETASYRGYSPSLENDHQTCRKLPIMLQFHGGGFVAGSKDSTANDYFCRRIAKLCDVIVIAVGYRLAPENRYPAAFEDGLKVLNWLGKQANLAECSKFLGSTRGGGGSDLRRSDIYLHITDTFGASMVEPWLAAHGDPSRFHSDPPFFLCI